jgi:hypothetical protein
MARPDNEGGGHYSRIVAAMQSKETEKSWKINEVEFEI